MRRDPLMGGGVVGDPTFQVEFPSHIRG
jgi:hypothetical protein